jgi:hypothetical protein
VMVLRVHVLLQLPGGASPARRTPASAAGAGSLPRPPLGPVSASDPRAVRCEQAAAAGAGMTADEEAMPLVDFVNLKVPLPATPPTRYQTANMACRYLCQCRIAAAISTCHSCCMVVCFATGARCCSFLCIALQHCCNHC